METLSTGATPRPLRRMVPLCSVFAPEICRSSRRSASVAVPVVVGAKLYVAKTCALVVPSDTGPPENGAAAAKISPEVIVSRTTTLNSSLDVEPTSVSAKSTSLGAVSDCADASGESVAIAARADAAVSQDLLHPTTPFDFGVPWQLNCDKPRGRNPQFIIREIGSSNKISAIHDLSKEVRVSI